MFILLLHYLILTILRKFFAVILVNFFNAKKFISLYTKTPRVFFNKM